MQGTNSGADENEYNSADSDDDTSRSPFELPVSSISSI